MATVTVSKRRIDAQNIRLVLFKEEEKVSSKQVARRIIAFLNPSR
jgi:hypothetical protein